MDPEPVDHLTKAVLWYSDRERQLERGRRLILDQMTRRPGATAAAALRGVTETASTLRRDLSDVFGYDAVTGRWKHAITLPMTECTFVPFYILNSTLAKYEGLLWAFEQGAANSRSLGEDPNVGGLKAFIFADRMRAWLDSRDAILAPSEDVRLLALASGAGTLLARINLNRNRRLRKAIPPGPHENRTLELARRLPAAILQALHEGGPHEHPDTVRNRAVRLLEYEHHSRTPHRQRRGKWDVEPVPWSTVAWPDEAWPGRSGPDPLPAILSMLAAGLSPDVIDEALRDQGFGSLAARLRCLAPDRLEQVGRLLGRGVSDFVLPPAEEFAAREHAALQSPVEIGDELRVHVESIARQHGLTPRETEVATLLAAKFKNSEIATRLGISAATVRVLRHRIEKKRKPAQTA